MTASFQTGMTTQGMNLQIFAWQNLGPLLKVEHFACELHEQNPTINSKGRSGYKGRVRRVAKFVICHYALGFFGCRNPGPCAEPSNPKKRKNNIGSDRTKIIWVGISHG